MSESIAKKYADSLQGKDITELFEALERLHGSISKAAKACGLERKTIYDWKRQVVSDNLKTGTKRKVVSALLDQLPEDTLEFMVERMISRTREILDIYLSTIYEAAAKENVPPKFLRIAERFGKSNVRYGSLIVGGREVETSNMINQLSHRAEELGVRFTIPPRNVYSSIQLQQLLPEALAEASRIGDLTETNKIADKLGLAPSVLQTIVESYRELRGLSPSTTSDIRPITAMPLRSNWKTVDLQNARGKIEISA